MGLKILGKMGIIAIKQDVMRIKLHDDTVICRVGSLENCDYINWRYCAVICRVGSLEKMNGNKYPVVSVICRVGSLENIGIG
mgnify:CR=1 FL=1